MSTTLEIADFNYTDPVYFPYPRIHKRVPKDSIFSSINLTDGTPNFIGNACSEFVRMILVANYFECGGEVHDWESLRLDDSELDGCVSFLSHSHTKDWAGACSWKLWAWFYHEDLGHIIIEVFEETDGHWP